ncbi:MAG: alpha/beta hydrolase [Candidatus Nanopelagicales bacterium]
MPTLDVNGHSMYYEVHGTPGAPRAVCMGGWGTFCHGRVKDAPRYLFDNYEVLIYDYRGIRDSTDDLSMTPSVELYASDVVTLLDHLGWTNVHIIGLVGMGACVGQQIAVQRPDLARTLLMTGCWAYADPIMVDQLKTMVDVHEQMGWPEFQKLAASYSFNGDFYNENRDRLLGVDGTWPDLNGRLEAQRRLVHACSTYDAREQLPQVQTPAIVVNAGRDPITTPRHTQLIADLMPNCESVDWPEATHVFAGKKMKKDLDALLANFLEAH